MVPPTIRHNLASLRTRERLLTFVWGAACWLAVVLVLLIFACLVDWFIDRSRETPMGVRLALFLLQAFTAAIATFVFLAFPQMRRLPDSILALWVEDKIPQFDHRLISAVQFNQPNADLGGMSTELVGVVTREAEKQAQSLGFAKVADHSRLLWSVGVLAPILLIAAIPVLVWPSTVFALLERQALRDVDVPHSVTLASASEEVWPIGDTIPIRYRVKGKYSADMIGTVSVTPQGTSTAAYKLEFLLEDEQGAIFGVDVLPSSVPSSSRTIRYSARIADGRTKYPSELKLVPRPVVSRDKAWILLPAFCDARPNVKEKKRYERPQERGDVIGIPGSAVRVQFEVDNAKHQAWIELLGPEKSDPNRSEEEGPVPEKVLQQIPMEIKKTIEFFIQDGEDSTRETVVAEATFDLVPGLTGYRMVVKNEYGFANVPPKRRSLRLVPEEAPQITLLRDTFGRDADFDLEGLPVLLGESIRIPYVCFGQYGLSRAQVRYRFLKKHESGNEPAEEEEWVRLPLTEVNPDAKAGAFDPKTGVFEHTGPFKDVPFHAVPSLNSEKFLGRTQGGGRVFLKTNGLIDSKGKRLQMKSGDQVEYCIEIFSAHREPTASTPFVRSETRVSTVVDDKGLFAWWQQVGDEDKRLRVLKAKQEGVFGGGGK
ncbi:MAG: hypothetical protein EXR98_19410 [Gemmataceae bacterium]|nr:hypothetical protein [Gemmataceae bacterium]